MLGKHDFNSNSNPVNIIPILIPILKITTVHAHYEVISIHPLPLPTIKIRALTLQSNYERNLKFEVNRGIKNTLGNNVASHNTTKYVDQYCFHLKVIIYLTISILYIYLYYILNNIKLLGLHSYPEDERSPIKWKYNWTHNLAEHKKHPRHTLGSDEMILKASATWDAVAPPPTSRKLAGSPPCSLIMSIVAIASPAPFTEKL